MIRRILHLSDIHAGADGRDDFGAAALSALDRVLDSLIHVSDIGLVVVTGDVADDASMQGTASVRDRIAAFARPRGIPQVYCMGNHDGRQSFSAELGTGHLCANGDDIGERWTGHDEIAATSVHAGLRVITLDSVAPGHVHGELGPEQLEWLSTVLSDAAPQGTIVAMHHPPYVPDGSLFFRGAALMNPEPLAAVIRDRDVRVVLTGHFHTPAFSLFGGVPTVIAPAVVWRIDPTSAPSVVRGLRGSGANLVDLSKRAPLVQPLTVHDPNGSQILFEIDAAILRPQGAPADSRRR